MNSDLYSTKFTIAGYATFWLAALVIGIFVVVTFVSFVSKREVVKWQMKALLFCFLVALSLWAFLWDPAPYYDSYKHFQWLNQIRQQKLGLLTFLKDGFQGSKIGNYYGLIGFNILRYVAVSISSNNHMLPFMCTAIDYLIFYYVVTDFFEREEISNTWFWVTWVMSFSFMSYFMVVSGIRNAVAASLAGLAIYNRLYKKHSYIEYLILAIVAVTIHPNVVLPILITVVYPLFRGTKSFLILVFSMIFFKFGYVLLKTSSISFLSYVGEVVEFYIVDNRYHGELTTYISDIVVLLCCLLLFIRNKNVNDAEKGTDEERYGQFIFIYCLAILTMVFVGATNFLTRGCYVLGILSVFFVKRFSKLSYTASREDMTNIVLITVIIFTSLINIGSELILLLAQFF